jgi:hypothetical protein
MYNIPRLYSSKYVIPLIYEIFVNNLILNQMNIKFKPFRIYVEKYHIADGNIYPPRVLNLKRVGILLAIIIAIIVAIVI